MKRSYLFGILFLFFLLLSCSKVQTPMFQVDPESNLYLVTSKSIQSYTKKENKLELHRVEKIDVATYVNLWFSCLNSGDKMIVTEGDDFAPIDHQNIISIDFSKGEMRKNHTKNYAMMGSGISSNYFYTAQTDAISGILTVFSLNGKQVFQKKFNQMTAISSQIVANNSNVYAEIAYQDPKRNRPEGVLDSDLIVLNEKEHWKEKDRIRLTSDGKKVEMLEGLAIVKDRAFVSISAIRDTDTLEKVAGNQLLSVDLHTGERKLFTLPNPYPNMLYPSPDNHYLVVKHEVEGKNILSVLDLQNETIKAIVLDDNSGETPEEINSFTISNENMLYLATGRHLLQYSLKDAKLIEKQKLKLGKDDFPIGLRIVEKDLVSN